MFPPCPSRLVCAHWGGIVSAGIVVATVYLYDDSAVSSRNRQLLKDVAAYLNALGKPFIIGGDWQVSPDTLNNSGWPHLARLKVMAPLEYTYVSGASCSHIDYFVVSEDIANYAECCCSVVATPVGEEPVIPKHRPVALTIRGSTKTRMVSVITAPPAIPILPAIGPRLTAVKPPLLA